MNTAGAYRPPMLAAEPAVPFSLELPGPQGGMLECIRIARSLPGKRLVCAGRLKDVSVYAKLYFAPGRAWRHWSRELEGIQALDKRGIDTPAARYAGRDAGGEAYVIVTTAIPQSASAREAWERGAQPREREALIGRLVETVARHHARELIQTDPHLGNFLITPERVYTLDGGSIRVVPGLRRTRALENLALLLAQFDPGWDESAAAMLERYAAVRGFDVERGDAAVLRRAIVRQRERRLRNYLKKIFRPCTAFAAGRGARVFWVYDRRWAGEEMNAFLADPDACIARAERMLKQGGASTVALIRFETRALVLKRYNLKGAWHRLRRALRRSRAARSWESAHRLLSWGIKTPEPVALLERRIGPIRRQAYLLTEHVEGERAQEFFDSDRFDDDEKSAVAARLVDTIQRLGELNLSHGDMKASNFIISGNEAYLIDLDAMRRHRIGFFGRRAHQRDVRRFLRNWKPEVAARWFSELNG